MATAAYEVGTATRDINPNAEEIASGKVYLGGYGVGSGPILGGRAANGVLGEGASVRAFTVGDGRGGALAIANMELQGWFAATKDGPFGITDMRRAVEQATHGELKAEQVIIQSDHSHSGVDGMGVWGGIPLTYRRRIFNRTVEAVVAAWKERKPAAELVYGVADGSDLLSNQFSWDDANRSVDHEVRVLQARDAAGAPITTLLNFSAHTTVLGSSNKKVSGDWVQRANPLLERELGGRAVTMMGTLGRTQPADRGCSDLTILDQAKRDLCTLDQYATRVVARAKDALAAAKPLPAEPVVKARSYLIQDASTSAALLGLMGGGQVIGAPLNRSMAPPWMTANVIGTVTGSALIGDVLLSAGPGEMYPQLPLTVRAAVGGKARGFMTAGLAGDQLGYIIGEAPSAYPGPICATLLEDCADEVPHTPGALPNDNYFFNVSHTMGERVICSHLRGADEILGTGLRAARPQCAAFANDLAFPSGTDVGHPSKPVTDLLGNGKITGDSKPGRLRAGVSEVDATYAVGPSAGQYATTRPEADPSGEFDPHVQQLKNHPSYGVQSRLKVRAVVIEGGDGRRYAIVKNDLYIPQDLLYRRTAQILETHSNSGITRETLTIASTHNHSSPYYTSTGWGAWAFQDVFDLRHFEHYAQAMAKAVMQAAGALRPVKIGAAVGNIDTVHRNSMGPSLADDGTPAGYPHGDIDTDLTVIRFDDLRSGKPYALLVNYSGHPEFLEGNDLISGDYIAPLERMVDRATGAKMVFTQGSPGTSEPERFSTGLHSVHERLEFTHKDYAQAEYGARLLADEVLDTFGEIGGESAPDDPSRFVPFADQMVVSMEDRWYPGPLSHPYPGVSSCRTDALLGGDPRVPVIGLPDCTNPFDQELPVNPGISTDTLQELGIPIPENYAAPAYTGLEEDVSVHLQALRLGDIVLTMCSCEQWSDQSKNIETRANQIAGDQYVGYDWASRCTQHEDGSWACPNPRNEAETLKIGDKEFKRFRAQVRNDAVGWDFLENVPYAESEPTDPTQIKGNYTHEELAPQDGYKLVVPVGMANDYNGYIATYREFQRGDHYRKALTAWGPHSSDYMATRLVQMAGHLKRGDGGSTPVLATEPERELADSIGRAKTEADMAHNDARVSALAVAAKAGIPAYEATLPDDGGTARIDAQPADVERFGAAFLRWNGGSNYADNPVVRVMRRVDGRWVEYADQSGEVPVRVEYPKTADGTLLNWASGSFEWKWTATFEAFVSPFDTGERPLATPAGEYKFVVDGTRRDGGAFKPYHLESRTFLVKPWSGITVEDFKVEDGSASFVVGPQKVVGPIDYPDSYGGALKDKFVREKRTAYNGPQGVEWFCFTCSFRPWVDAGDASAAAVTVRRASGSVESVAAVRDGDRWRAPVTLGKGDSAFVAAGGVQDEWGNFNGAPSSAVAVPADPVAPPAEPAPDPAPEPSPEPSAVPDTSKDSGTTTSTPPAESAPRTATPAPTPQRPAAPPTTAPRPSNTIRSVTRTRRGIAGLRATCRRAAGGRTICRIRTAGPAKGRVLARLGGRRVGARLVGGRATVILRGRGTVRIEVRAGGRTGKLTQRV